MSPYLQIFEILNQPLQSFLLFKLHLLSHDEDLVLIPLIQQTITQYIMFKPKHITILLEDFNQDISLNGRYQNTTYIPPSIQDIA